ncbi:acyl-CoA thioesterase [Roseococcus sp. YIM B11640]|uniref:acyl-CoA thioesterase n=1 Tax=Roseococcus sp. YIM B11640 TaxID=3133973 RepID=UPI003C7AA715
MSRPQPLPASALPAAAARIPGRIRFSDCDPAGIAFFGAWFTLANAAIEDFFDMTLGVDFHHLHGERRTGTGFVHAEADWFSPGRMGDRILFTPIVTRIGGASYSTTLHAHRQETELVRFRFVNATTDLDSARSRPVPEDLRGALARYAASCESLAP